jgi:hypothetical protein
MRKFFEWTLRTSLFEIAGWAVIVVGLVIIAALGARLP